MAGITPGLSPHVTEHIGWNGSGLFYLDPLLCLVNLPQFMSDEGVEVFVELLQ